MEALFDAINDALAAIDDFIWGPPLMALILFGGILLTLRLRGLQFIRLPRALRYMVKNEKDGSGEVTSFGALCTALSATIGTGNIVGVATAIVAGGPGAMFWMWLAALFGMATKYSEGLLAVKYRSIDKKTGHVLGGPFYYIERGMGKNWRWLAKVFAFFGMCVGLFGIGTFTQVNSISSAITGFFDPNKAVTVSILGIDYSIATIVGSLLLAILVGLVVIGGLKRIAKVSERVIPVMVVVYVGISLVLIICNIDKLPGAFVTIVQSAFGFQAAAGGMLGAIIIAMQNGIARGIFSNEAGLGSAPIAAAAAQTKEPVRQGLVSMTGTFLDTIVVCSMTGLALVMTGAYQIPGLEGAAVTTAAFQSGLPFIPGEAVSFVLMLCLALFGFTTILGWDYYGERCLEYFSNDSMKRRQGVPLALHCRRVHRPVHDRGRRVDHRRHLQRLHGHPQHHRTRRAFGHRSEGDPQLLHALGCRRRRRRRHGEASVRSRGLEDSAPRPAGRAGHGSGALNVVWGRSHTS